MMLGAAVRRCQAAALLVVAAVLCSTTTRATSAEPPPFSKWFKYSSDIEKSWDVASDAAQPMYVSLRRKDATGPLKRILVLYPRPSSAYDIAITEILRTFAAKEINSHIEVVNFELNDARGKAALQAAEKNSVDLIFAMGSESAAWLFENYKGGALPVVTVCSKDPVQLGHRAGRSHRSGGRPR